MHLRAAKHLHSASWDNRNPDVTHPNSNPFLTLCMNVRHKACHARGLPRLHLQRYDLPARDKLISTFETTRISSSSLVYREAATPNARQAPHTFT